ncbi:hypothetical protein TNCT6_75200 [Streptomyces sp. 6-11-2]|nr:hypothetical protein TNCT6_75200 [Streptomyces sp. 6-11-2]
MRRRPAFVTPHDFPEADEIVVDCVNPLGFDKPGAYALRPENGSAAQRAACSCPLLAAAIDERQATEEGDARCRG